MKRIDVKAGKTVQFKGKTLKVTLSDAPCGHCYFGKFPIRKGCCFFKCIAPERKEQNNVVFINRSDIADKLKGKRK